MVQVNRDLSTGLPKLDHLLRGVQAGDNIVWQVESIEDYLAFVEPYATAAIAHGKKLIYFRFAAHPPLLCEEAEAERYNLDPEAGFEAFIDAIHETIEKAGRGAFYIFDCLSDLVGDWFSDQMLGNFFMLTCPYLFDLETVTYFGLLRNHHSLHAIEPIRRTTQLYLDVYRHENRIYLRPLKVQHRYSPTMHMLHVWDEHGFQPVNHSYTMAEVLTTPPRSALDSAIYQLDVWHRVFLSAEDTLRAHEAEDGEEIELEALFHRLLRMVVSRDDRVLKLAEQYLDLPYVLAIGRRTIGSGLIGGKAVGMLLARAILRGADPKWENILEIHDSFFIASDVFYTFLVRNGCWWIRKNQANPNTFLVGAGQARRRILTGVFPDEIKRQFEEMLEYYGQSPIIVRSSSLLEDNFGNAFAGKYDSVFCANQGSLHERLEDFLSAVKTVYASSMSEEALAYRARHGLLDRDEQMSILVQRVSGSRHNKLFFPQVAGVGFSFNPYAWSEYIDPKAGMLRLVFGLGTRAVDRADDDYTRIVALNAPERRPEAAREGAGLYAQRKVDLIDFEENQLVTRDFQDTLEECAGIPVSLFAARDAQLARAARDSGLKPSAARRLNFDALIKQTPFIQDMRDLLEILQTAYDYPVDVEFTANFVDQQQYKLNLVQCRPLQVRSASLQEEVPENLQRENILLQTSGPVIGRSRVDLIRRLIYVHPTLYGQLPMRERYAVARLIGRLTALEEETTHGDLMLLGPGRWGTTTPSLGVPVTFAEINTVSILCEIVAMRDDLVPDVSMGTHFFSELVEMDMLYLALFPDQDGNSLNGELLDNAPDKLLELLPDATAFAGMVRVIDSADIVPSARVKLHADSITQRVICYLD